MVKPLSFGNGLLISSHPTLYWVYDYLSMLGFKLIYINEMDPWVLAPFPVIIVSACMIKFSSG